MENQIQLQLSIQKVNVAKCSKGNQATVVCCSQYCKNNAFLCKDQRCQCRLSHKLCFQLVLDKLEEIILASSYSLQPLEDKIIKIFDTAIDQLSEQRDWVLNKIKNDFDYLGLNESEKKFIYALKNGTNEDQINCQFVWKIHAELKDQQGKKNYWTEIEKQIKKIEQDLTLELCRFNSKVLGFLMKIQTREGNTFIQSKIAKTVEYRMDLQAFFGKKNIQSTQLLYRASENEFLVSKFHQKCDNIPSTLVLIETEFGKVIGGFTSSAWRRSTTNIGEYICAEQNSEDYFIFSLTNKDKFFITKNAGNGIYYRQNDDWGPCFGCGFDLGIYNKANQNSNSSAIIGTTYTNSKYEYNDVSAQKKFQELKVSRLRSGKFGRYHLKSYYKVSQEKINFSDYQQFFIIKTSFVEIFFLTSEKIAQYFFQYNHQFYPVNSKNT